MTTILLSIGIVIAFAIMFWLDKRQGPEPTPALVHLFDVLRNLRWDMNQEDIKRTFVEFKHASAKRLNKKTTLVYKESSLGQEIHTTFSFPVDNEGSANKCEIRLSRVNEKDIDLLFSTVCKQYGQPTQSGQDKEGEVIWAYASGILTLENTAPEEYLLTLTEEDNKASP